MAIRPMYVTLALVLLMICVAPKGFTRRATAETEDQERAAIRAVLTEQQTAWNHGDVAAFMRGYWNSPQLTFAGSTGFVRGWEPVTSRYEREYPNQAAMGKLDFSDLEIRSLGPDAALVLGKWHLDRAAGGVGGIFSLVFQRFPEGWRIVHDHTSVIAAPAS